MSFFGTRGQFDFSAWSAADQKPPPAQPLPTPPPEAPRGDQSGPSAPPPPPTTASANFGTRVVKEGDWECPSCGNVNFAKRTRCNKCHAGKPKTGDPLVDVPHFGGPPGLFKKGDWPCAHCGNVNWARRDKCNICNAPKLCGGEEPRMGRGGGHFDLQDPSDRNLHDSDEEDFDEFGRKKKRQRMLLPTTGVLPQSVAATAYPSVEEELKLAFPPAPVFRRRAPTEPRKVGRSHSRSRGKSRSRSRSRSRPSVSTGCPIVNAECVAGVISSSDAGEVQKSGDCIGDSSSEVGSAQPDTHVVSPKNSADNVCTLPHDSSVSDPCNGGLGLGVAEVSESVEAADEIC